MQQRQRARQRTKRVIMSAASFVAIAAIAIGAGISYAASSFSNGFETDTSGWYDDGSTINRVASPTDGVSAASGNYFAQVTAGAFTRWGSYESVFPTNGYSTQVDIYLDMNENTVLGTDNRFDYSSAISRQDGSHLRDFIFSVGTDPLTTGQFVMSASNNAPGWPANPGRDPYTIDQTGWYTFRHTFENDGGVLKVTMSVLNSSGIVLHSWELSNPADLIASVVGGNRYGWFVDSDFAKINIDNSQLSQPDVEAPDVAITNPTNGSTVSGIVDVRGTVTDASPDHYYLKISGPSGTVYSHTYPETNSFTDMSIYSWNTTAVPDGNYKIQLEARDAFNNKDSGSIASVNVVVNNTPDNKDQCKNDNWMTFTKPSFKNQGACVSFVNHNNGVGMDDVKAGKKN